METTLRDVIYEWSLDYTVKMCLIGHSIVDVQYFVPQKTYIEVLSKCNFFLQKYLHRNRKNCGQTSFGPV